MSEDMCEHGTNSRTMMMIAGRHLVGVINKRAEFRTLSRHFSTLNIIKTIDLFFTASICCTLVQTAASLQ